MKLTINISILLLLFCAVSNAEYGPIGYDLFRNINRVSELRTGVHTRQFSSFDRQGGNNDGGAFDCLRKTTKGSCVLAEWLGAGEIESIWTTRDNGVFNKTGHILIELDDEPVIYKHLQNVVDGELGDPLIWPFVGNGDDTSGGGVIKVPMSFTKSMRITTDTNPIYYHITFRSFADSNHIKTFDITDPAIDTIKQLRGFGVRDPKPVQQNEETVTFETIVNADTTKIIFEKSNTSASIKEIRLHFPQLVRSPRVVDDGRAFGADGWSAFIADVDPKNNGIRITRKLDSNVHNQIARILIDGLDAGKWNSSGINISNGWVEEIVQIDSKFSLNKTHVHIKNVFESSSYDFNEFRYDIDCLVDGQWMRTDVVEIGPNHPGEESTHHYEIFGQTFAGQRVFRYKVDQQKLNISDNILAQTNIRILFDNRVTVDAPIGEFFGCGLGMYDTRALWFGIDARNAVFTTWWSMPFANNATIQIITPKDLTIGLNVYSKVIYAKDNSIAEKLNTQKIGYFHATHKREHTVPALDYIFLNTTGHGIVYGVTHTMRGLIKTGNMADYLEGDERIYVDSQLSPHLYGTGTEDFYESGWYFRGGITYDMPLAGCPAHEIQEDDCENECFGAIRLFSEGISFELAIVLGIEHGPVDNNEPGIYSSVTYWYGQPNIVLKQSDFVDLTDSESRRSHNYSAIGEHIYALNSSYEGYTYKTNRNSNVTTANGQIMFEININPNNTGVRIFRTSDQQMSYQTVNVLIDEHSIGTWLQPLGNKWSRWLDDSYDIPLSISSNKTQLKLKLIPVSYSDGPVLWSASHYRIFSIIV